MTTSKPPRAKRIERLTKRKPVFRLIGEDDWPVIAVAYERGAALPFEPGLGPVEMRARFDDLARQGYRLSAVEDENPNFRAGRGLVALVMAKYDNWTLSPELIKFPWATKFNVVRGLAAFLLEMKRSHVVGVTVLSCKDNSKKLLDRLSELKLIYRCGYIPNGYEDGPQWIWNLSGKKKAVTDGN